MKYVMGEACRLVVGVAVDGASTAAAATGPRGRCMHAYVHGVMDVVSASTQHVSHCVVWHRRSDRSLVGSPIGRAVVERTAPRP